MKVRVRQTSFEIPTERIIWAYEGGNPRSQPFKQLEMAVKRAYQINSGLIDSLAEAGDIAALKEQRMWWITSNKDLKDALNLSAYSSEDAAIRHQDVWEWMVDHWYTGGLKRSVIATMDNLTKENRQVIKTRIEDLYE